MSGAVRHMEYRENRFLRSRKGVAWDRFFARFIERTNRIAVQIHCINWTYTDCCAKIIKMDKKKRRF